jgi:hypothetical protein
MWIGECDPFTFPGPRESKKLTQAVSEFDGENLPLPVAEIPWGHNILLLEKLKSSNCIFKRKTADSKCSKGAYFRSKCTFNQFSGATRGQD